MISLCAYFLSWDLFVKTSFCTYIFCKCIVSCLQYIYSGYSSCQPEGQLPLEDITAYDRHEKSQVLDWQVIKTTSLVNFSTFSECGKVTVPSIHSLWRFCWTDIEGVYFWFSKTVNWGKENGIKSNSVTCSERNDFCQRFSFPCNFREKYNVWNWLTQHRPPLRDLFDVLIKSSDEMITFGAAGIKFTVRCRKENSNFSFSVCCITTVFKPLVLTSDLQCRKIKELSDTKHVL